MAEPQKRKRSRLYIALEAQEPDDEAEEGASLYGESGRNIARFHDPELGAETEYPPTPQEYGTASEAGNNAEGEIIHEKQDSSSEEDAVTKGGGKQPGRKKVRRGKESDAV